MKKIIILLIIFSFICIFISNKNVSNDEENKEFRAFFVSYIELKKYISKDINLSKRNIDEIINNANKMKFNTIILQVRSFNDSIYSSSIFPCSSIISGKEEKKCPFDILQYFIDKAHSNGILLYAWINPYRVRLNNDLESISKYNPAYKYIGSNKLYINDGIYLNPASDEVLNLVVDGVSEIVDNYKVDGILFDDYFYPNDEIDNVEYQEYKKSKNINLKDYHLMIINNMIKKVHTKCMNRNIQFGVSPDANNDNNYNKNYADVKKWGKSSEYVDFIMPQIYYGFFNEAKPYKIVSDEWNDIVSDKVKLYIALAFYKVGVSDNYAKSGKLEWINNNNMIMKQVILARNLSNYQGFSLFRYDYIFNEEMFTDNAFMEVENLKKILN